MDTQQIIDQIRFLKKMQDVGGVNNQAIIDTLQYCLNMIRFQNKKFVITEIECPNCGNFAIILTSSNTDDAFYDGDEALCGQCHNKAQWSCDSETPGVLFWHDE